MPISPKSGDGLPLHPCPGPADPDASPSFPDPRDHRRSAELRCRKLDDSFTQGSCQFRVRPLKVVLRRIGRANASEDSSP